MVSLRGLALPLTACILLAAAVGATFDPGLTAPGAAEGVLGVPLLGGRPLANPPPFERSLAALGAWQCPNSSSCGCRTIRQPDGCRRLRRRRRLPADFTVPTLSGLLHVGGRGRTWPLIVTVYSPVDPFSRTMWTDASSLSG